MTHQTSQDLTDLTDLNQFVAQLKIWAQQLGFADCGISSIDLSDAERRYFNWLDRNLHGDLEYMVKHGTKRTRPGELIAGTKSIISLRMNYFDPDSFNPVQQLHQPAKAYISRYALGRDYHKLVRKRLKQFTAKIEQYFPQIAHRIFTDSAPVLEKPIAYQAGLGFIGKNSLIIHPKAGSWFFLAEIYTDLELPTNQQTVKNGCGPCNACRVECPTQAIIEDGIVDASRCISYLTIEHFGAIPEEFRTAIGNRIYGCDDCQLVCPWNNFLQPNQEDDYKPRHFLDQANLLELFAWSEEEFNRKLEGSPIRRIGHERWLRNIAIALGNANFDPQIIADLTTKKAETSEMVQQHIDWALAQQNAKSNQSIASEKSAQIIEITPDQIKPYKAKRYYLGRRKR